MKIRFYGVRGSIPTPLTNDALQSKISSIIQRITPLDLTTQDTREKFLSRLPPWLFGTVGGETSSILLTSDDGDTVVLDAGSGIRLLGKDAIKSDIKHFDIFLSHFHYDHIQGLPFFEPIFKKDVSIDFYSCFSKMEDYLVQQQLSQYFPVPFSALGANIKFHPLDTSDTIKVGGMTVSICKMQHPGGSYSFSFSQGGRKFVYATDVEISKSDFSPAQDHERVFRDADLLVIDSQYTSQEFYKKPNWGHSSFCYAVDFANFWGAKKICLFHHEPTYDDKKLEEIREASAWYAKFVAHSDVEVSLATEGQIIEI